MTENFQFHAFVLHMESNRN